MILVSITVNGKTAVCTVHVISYTGFANFIKGTLLLLLASEPAECE